MTWQVGAAWEKLVKNSSTKGWETLTAIVVRHKLKVLWIINEFDFIYSISKCSIRICPLCDDHLTHLAGIMQWSNLFMPMRTQHDSFKIRQSSVEVMILVPTFNYFRPPPLNTDQLTWHHQSEVTKRLPSPYARPDTKSEATQHCEANVTFAEQAVCYKNIKGARTPSHSLDITHHKHMSRPDSKSIYQM